MTTSLKGHFWKYISDLSHFFFFSWVKAQISEELSSKRFCCLFILPLEKKKCVYISYPKKDKPFCPKEHTKDLTSF